MSRALGLALLMAALAPGPAHAVGQGQKAPEFQLSSLKAGKIALSELRGKVVLLDFWAQWCEPCKKELPELEKLAKQFAAKDVVVLTVSIDKQRANAERLVKQLGLSFEVALDPSGSVAAACDLPKMPTSFLIDKKGTIRFVHEGFEGAGDVERFKRELEELTK